MIKVLFGGVQAMAQFLGLVGMIAVGALLIFMASNKKARYLLWKMNIVTLLSKTTKMNKADEIYLTVVPLIAGIFLLGTGFVLILVYLLK